MFRKILMNFAVLAGMSVSGALAAPFQYTWERPVGYIATSHYTETPSAFLAFCKRHPGDCTPDLSSQPVDLDVTHMRQLNEVNMDVNDTYAYGMDLAGHDTWDYPKDNYADCEDFALVKRKRLMDMGWPTSALLLTLAQARGEDMAQWKYHVTLTVRTLQGDYVLDDQIRPAVAWDKAARLYEFLTMQSAQDPKLWVAVPQSVNASIDSTHIVR